MPTTTLEPFERSHLALLASWLAQPHVAHFQARPRVAADVLSNRGALERPCIDRRALPKIEPKCSTC